MSSGSAACRPGEPGQRDHLVDDHEPLGWSLGPRTERRTRLDNSCTGDIQCAAAGRAINGTVAAEVAALLKVSAARPPAGAHDLRVSIPGTVNCESMRR
jgi:hypothetical protein